MSDVRRYRKPHLPRKTCPVCARPFAWRKKWAREWDRVVYCSDRCRQRRGRSGAADQASAV